MDDTRKRAGLKRRLLTLLKGGARSLVLATAVVAGPSEAAPTPPAESVLQRAAKVQAALSSADKVEDQRDRTAETRLAWWGNWGNGGWHPGWHNWPNGWHNWPNWRNW